MKRLCLTLAVATTLSLGILGCEDDENPGPIVPQNGTVTLQIEHVAGSAPVTFDSFDFANAAGQTYSIETLKYYLSHIELAEGGEAGITLLHEEELADVHYVDAADAATMTLTRGVGADTYTELRFVFGLDDEANLTDALPATQENINMLWPEPMGGGYHYMKLEGKFLEAAGDTLNYRTHTGRNGPAGTGTPHFFMVTLSLSLTIDGNAATIPLIMDVNQWYENPHEYSFPVDAMIMGNVEVQNQLQANGASAFSLGTITTE